MHRKTLFLLVMIVFTFCLLVSSAGCRKKDPEAGPNEVWLIGWNYIPDALTVPAGTTVTWNNTTLDYHTVTSDDGIFDFRMGAGTTFNFTFEKPGTYGYHDAATDPPTTGKIIVR